MASAARVGDKTEHNSAPLGPGPGSTNVSIGKKPAWRATTDVHTCSKSDGTKPHVGGVVTFGSRKVFINGFSAVRSGDRVTEAGPPNSITEGFDKVQIGG